jgi:tRNA-specific 2-thiouridylase
LPIGDHKKADVRKLAEHYSLPTASRRESQDLCFLAGGDYRDFLRRCRPELFVGGNIVRASGEVLGEHGGLVNYTIGQRKGLGLPSSVPMYVLRKDVVSGNLVVGVEEELGERELEAANVHWLSGQPNPEPFRAHVKTRYTAREAAAEVFPLDGGRYVRIVFDSPQRDITRGQAAVFYQDEYVLGGGLIA